MWQPQTSATAVGQEATPHGARLRAGGSGVVASLTKLFEAGPAVGQFAGQQPFPLPRVQQESGATTPSTASTAPSASPASSSSPSQQQPEQKRLRLGSDASTALDAEAEGGVERQLFPAAGGGCGGGTTDEDAAAAREARLAKIRARFGTRRFLPAREPDPAELRQQLGAKEEDLDIEDYKLHRWDAFPVVLSGTSNAFCLNWVLSGQSGCVGLASTLAHLFVLGGGQTIFIEEADAVHAQLDGAGVYIRLGNGDQVSALTLKVINTSLAAEVVSILNGRAGMRAALRQRAAMLAATAT